MKKLSLLGAVFTVMMVFASISAFASSDSKDFEFATREDGKLKIYGFVAEYPEPPADVPEEVAWQMIQRKVPNYVVSGKSNIHVDRLFWRPKANIQTARTRIMWNGVDWDESKLAPTSKEVNNIVYGMLVLIASGILVVSIISQHSTSGKQDWRLFVFYGAIASAALMGWIVNQPNIDEAVNKGILIVSIGVLVGGLAGILTSELAGKLSTSISIAFGILTGALTSTLASALALNWQPKMLIQFLSFLLAIFTISFVIAKITGRAILVVKSGKERKKVANPAKPD